MLRFHLDEHVPYGVAQGLRQHGIDVSTSADARLRGAADVAHLAFAQSQGRVIVSHDQDFLRHHATGIVHSGIAYCRQDKYGIGESVQLLLLLNASHGADDLAGRIEFL